MKIFLFFEEIFCFFMKRVESGDLECVEGEKVIDCRRMGRFGDKMMM